MLALLKQPETFNGLNSINLNTLDDEAPEVISGDLNVEFVREFKQAGLSDYDLQQIVYIADTLYEVTQSSSFPNDRILSTPDVNASDRLVTCYFSEHAKRVHDVTQHGCTVSAETMDLIKEFLDYQYLQLLDRVLTVLNRNFLMFKLDREDFAITLQRSSPHRDFGLLTFSVVQEKKSFTLPFNLERLKGK